MYASYHQVLLSKATIFIFIKFVALQSIQILQGNT